MPTTAASKWRPSEPGGARRRPQERLSADRIVQTALEQIRAHGYDNVSMRTIATALRTGPASLYAHVHSKAHLDQLLMAWVSGQVDIPEADPARWKDQLVEVMSGLMSLYREYPGLAAASFGMIPTEPESLRVAEGMMAIMLAGGISPQYAGWTLDVVSTYVGGAAYEESLWAQRLAENPATSEEEEVAGVQNLFAELPAGEFPQLRAHAAVLTSGDSDERFLFGLHAFIAGIEAMSKAERSG